MIIFLCAWRCTMGPNIVSKSHNHYKFSLNWLYINNFTTFKASNFQKISCEIVVVYSKIRCDFKIASTPLWRYISSSTRTHTWLHTSLSHLMKFSPRNVAFEGTNLGRFSRFLSCHPFSLAVRAPHAAQLADSISPWRFDEILWALFWQLFDSVLLPAMIDTRTCDIDS